MMGMGTIPSEIIGAAQSANRKWGVPASVTLSQWILESNWGKSVPPGSLNFFGIKAIPGQPFVTSWTHETLHGVYQAIPQHFARYASIDEAFEAHARLLATSHYYVKAQHDHDPDGFAMDLQGIYATGIPGHPYGPALIAIMKAADLYQYDTPSRAPDTAAPLVIGDPAGLSAAFDRLGYYGSSVGGMVRLFQAGHPPLAVDGIAGQKTIAALNAELAKLGAAS